MLHPGQCLPFAAKAGEDKLSIHAWPNQFDGDCGPVFIVVALGQKDRSHAAASQLAGKAVWPHVSCFGFREFQLVEGKDSVLDSLLNETALRHIVTGDE